VHVKLAETEEIDIRLYSIIYDAINEIKAAMEGMLAPEFEEKIVCNIEIREVFNITKVGTIAGCYVLDGKSCVILKFVLSVMVLFYLRWFIRFIKTF
jgi:translation initiation factor IF-2